MAMTALRGPTRQPLWPAAWAVAAATGTPVTRAARILGLQPSGGARAAGAPGFDEAMLAALRAINDGCDLPPDALPRRRQKSPRVVEAPAVQPTLSQRDYVTIAPPAPRPLTPPKPVDPDRALVEDALAKGRVTHVGSGRAAGLSQLEDQFHAAPPPLSETAGWGNKTSGKSGGQAARCKAELAKRAEA